MQKALQGDRMKEIERPFVEKGTRAHPPQHNTRHRVERLESFAFLKEFSGISYQTHSGGREGRALEISHWDSLQNGVGWTGKVSLCQEMFQPTENVTIEVI